MREDEAWARLAEYLAGECSAADAAAFEHWIAQDPDRRQLLAEAREIWRRMGRAPADDGKSRAAREREAVVDAAWGRMAARLGAGARSTPRAQLHIAPEWRAHVSPWRRARGAAAAAVIIVVGAGLVWRTAPWRTAQAGHPVTLHEFAAGRGERATLRLSDSTRVVLGAESRLWVPSDFDDTARTVRLEGEAYFEVAHDPAKPFIVHAGRAITQVLGTEFSVRAYPGDAQVDVAVRSGRVGLRAERAPPGRETVLERGQVGHLDSAGVTTVVKNADIETALGWTTGHLTFDREAFRDVIPEIERWYGLSIRLGDSTLGERRLTASFADESSDEVLDALALLVDARVERHGHQATFTAKPAR
jgi:ferric-dicitrate binding protein FerR (iron transport regulator)